MSDDWMPIFVYGTLQRGEERAHCWPHEPVRVESALIRAQLFDLGPYPALGDGEDLVRGELWFVRPEDLPETLRVLDEIECFGREEVDLYVRRQVPCETIDGVPYRAHVYYLADPAVLRRYPRVRVNEHGYCHWRRNS